MGSCSSSGSSRKNEKLTAEEGADLLDTYLRIERDIYREERSPPAPALGHAMVKLDRMAGELDSAMVDMSSEREDLVQIPGTVPEMDTMRLENFDESIRRVLHELSINRMPDQAQEHEEFISNLNRKAMKQHRIYWLNKRKEDAQDDVTRLSERIQHLQSLYQHHDSLVGGVGAPKSDLMPEFERLRSYRDTLYNAELSWRDALRLVQAAATLSRSGLDNYSQLRETLNNDSRWRLAQDARNSLHEAVLCVQAAMTSLPGVQFPYCSMRELQALMQVLEYIYTDMQIPDRYRHGSDVYNSFQKRTMALYQWIKKTMEETIHKDVVDVDQKLSQITTNMTNSTANFIRQKAGLGANKGYDPESLAARIRDDYDRKLLNNTVINNNSMVMTRDPIRPLL
ncbi:Hypothetical protein NTJ_07969 [Nesidiocoris tenuis]|uniref:Uncharacterized protein n=1 Tax=Nesidiocoris tenuis TaxID=355587 RepID=A0ABN7AV25_9HEMI|nr:Hypothetical protein NTJ_07969 [Nesidiocoris tenuis]